MKYHFVALMFIQGLFVLSGCKNGSDSKEVLEQLQPEAPEYTAFSEGTAAAISSYFNEKHNANAFNGVVLIASKDSIYSHAFGLKRFEDTVALDTSDLFQLGSVTKPITAFGLLHLLEKRQIPIQTKVKEILPLFYDDHITIEQLLNHTSGVGNYLYMTDSLWANPDSAIGNQEIQCYFEEGKIPAYYTPGRTFDYCNSNYALAASLIEVISGMPFREYMKERIFTPLKMHQSHYVDMKRKNSLEYPVYGHYPSGKKKLPLYVNGVVGDKGLYASVGDLFKFYQEIKKPTLISDSLRDLAILNGVEVSEKGTYGLGWRVKNLDQKRLVYHNGWWRGFRAYFWMDLKKDQVVIILTNHIAGGYLNQAEIFNLID